jgi:hypothetical protein
MTIVLQWKEECFVANTGIRISQCRNSDEDSFAVEGGCFVANKGIMILQYHNPDGDCFSVEIGMA